MIGVRPIFKLTKGLALTTDLSYILNFKQHYDYAGNSFSFYQGNINLYNNQLDLIKPKKEGVKLIVDNTIINNLKSFKRVFISEEIPCVLQFYDGDIEIIIKHK